MDEIVTQFMENYRKGILYLKLGCGCFTISFISFLEFFWIFQNQNAAGNVIQQIKKSRTIHLESMFWFSMYHIYCLQAVDEQVSLSNFKMEPGDLPGDLDPSDPPQTSQAMVGAVTVFLT